MKSIIAVFCFAFLSFGCVAFHPEPISPVDAASGLESRTADNPGLRDFIEKNTGHEITPWPTAEWDLSKLVLTALYYHPDMDTARARWGVADAAIITAGGVPNPAVTPLGEHHSYTVGGLSPWSAGLSLSIPVETAGKRGYRIDRARHLSDAARMDLAGAAWQVRSRVRRRLLALYSIRETEDILARELSVEQEIVKALEQRLAVGYVSGLDVILSRISLDRIELSIHDAERREAGARVDLAEALGLPSAALQEIHLSFHDFDNFPRKFTADDARRTALTSRTDILSSLARYESAQSALRLEIARQYPDFSLGPGFLWDQGDNVWSLALTAVLPVFNRNRGPIMEAAARRKELAAQFTALQFRVLSEIDHALTVYNAALKELDAADALVSDRKESLAEFQARLKAGQADRLEILGAQAELLSAENSRLDVFIIAQESLGMLEDALQRPLDEKEILPTMVGSGSVNK